jgi:hypothetical protein
MLHDEAVAARADGDVEKAEQFSCQCRSLVEGSYRRARQQSLTLA